MHSVLEHDVEPDGLALEPATDPADPPGGDKRNSRQEDSCEKEDGALS